MYQLNSKVRYSEADSNEKLTCASLLNYFQDSSTLHSENLGASGRSLYENHMAWILSFWQICIEDMPKLSEDIVVSTWPYDTKGLFGMRNFCMETADGKRLASANSIWVLINTETGRPIKIPSEVGALYPDEPKLEMDYCDRKIAIPSEYEEKEPVRVAGYFIDTNRHMNNGKYVMVAEEYLPEDFQVKEIRVEYKKAAVLNDVLYPRVTVTDKDVTIVLTDEVGSPYATVLFIK
ncbi:MAG: acyl-ACP thioesterase [Agathobacter sp.]|nr:acyl-ACP thioesterase [Agathobacter sp.]